MTDFAKLKRCIESKIETKIINFDFEKHERKIYLLNQLIKKLEQEYNKTLNEKKLATEEIIDIIKNNLNSDEETLESLSNSINFLRTLSDEEYEFLKDTEQCKNAKENIINIIAKIKVNIQKLEQEINANKKRFNFAQRSIIPLKNYLSMFDENGMKRGLTQEEYNNFIMTIKNLNLDNEIVYSLIKEITRYNISQLEVKKKLENAIISSEISRNAELALEEISQIELAHSQNIVQEEFQIEESLQEEPLTEEEEEIARQIESIIQVLKEKGINIAQNFPIIDNFVTKNNYIFEERESIYDIESTKKWEIILYDLVNNLKPNLLYHKQEIIKIYNHIIQEYNAYLQREQELKYILENIPVISEATLKDIEEILENYKEKLKNYASLSEQDKNIIDSYYSVIQSGENIKSIDESNFKIEDIIEIKNLIELKKLYEENKAYIELIDSAKRDQSLEQLKDIIPLQIENIKRIEYIIHQIRLKEQGRIKTKNPVIGENRTYNLTLSNAKNLIVFLDGLESGQPFVTNDQNSIKESHKEDLKDVAGALKVILDTKESDWENKKSRCAPIAGNLYDDELKPRRIRKNNIRVATNVLKLSKENKEKLKQMYRNQEDIRIVLITGFDYSSSEKQEVYGHFNSRMEQNILKIREINRLFYEPFTDETFTEACAMIESGFDIYKLLAEDPLRPLSQTGSKGRR